MKTWEKPQLIVLVRGRPEEALIIYCKGMGITGDPSEDFNGCAEILGSASVLCSDCYNNSNS